MVVGKFKKKKKILTFHLTLIQFSFLYLSFFPLFFFSYFSNYWNINSFFFLVYLINFIAYINSKIDIWHFICLLWRLLKTFLKTIFVNISVSLRDKPPGSSCNSPPNYISTNQYSVSYNTARLPGTFLGLTIAATPQSLNSSSPSSLCMFAFHCFLDLTLLIHQNCRFFHF